MGNVLFVRFGVLVLTVGVLAAVSSNALTSEPNVVSACVNPSSGEIKIARPGSTCGDDRVLLTWGQTGPQGPSGPAGPAGPAGPSGISQVQYVFGGIYPDTSVARAFCPTGTKVVGGGGFSLNGAGLQQTFPISDETGVVAWGTTAIGWQVAAQDWSDVQAYVICAM